MKLSEYNNIKGHTYLEYCDYLQNKYGIGKENYMCISRNGKWRKNPKRSRTNEGLYAHHKYEDRIQNLGKTHIANRYPFEWQKPENLIYCDLLEHLYLHILICEYPSDSAETDEVGINGIELFIAPELENLYNNNYKTKPQWQQNCHNLVKDDKDVYLILLQRFKENQRQREKEERDRERQREKEERERKKGKEKEIELKLEESKRRYEERKSKIKKIRTFSCLTEKGKEKEIELKLEESKRRYEERKSKNKNKWYDYYYKQQISEKVIDPNFKCKELKVILKKNGLKLSGNKNELIERLVNNEFKKHKLELEAVGKWQYRGNNWDGTHSASSLLSF